MSASLDSPPPPGDDTLRLEPSPPPSVGLQPPLLQGPGPPSEGQPQRPGELHVPSREEPISPDRGHHCLTPSCPRKWRASRPLQLLLHPHCEVLTPQNRCPPLSTRSPTPGQDPCFPRGYCPSASAPGAGVTFKAENVTCHSPALQWRPAHGSSGPALARSQAPPQRTHLWLHWHTRLPPQVSMERLPPLSSPPGRLVQSLGSPSTAPHPSQVCSLWPHACFLPSPAFFTRKGGKLLVGVPITSEPPEPGTRQEPSHTWLKEREAEMPPQG